ncbi:MAG: phosphoribosylformylglycinamidine cyclo-ligase [Candidatus Anstonellales archaeon]
MVKYRDVGIDIKKAAKIHELIEKIVRSTENEFSYGLFGHYAGILVIGKEKIAVTNDGVGSKILVARSLNRFDTVGIDCVAMVANDIICVGARPVAIVDYIALQKQDDKLVLELIKGLAKGAREAGCVIVGGETAILSDIINGFDIEATCVGVVEKEVIDGSKIRRGDVIVGLESSGLHSNGYTLARKLLGKGWEEEMLKPTRIYVSAIREMSLKCKINGLAHITGGAFSKLTRLSRHFGGGFVLDNMPELGGIFRELYEKLGKNDYEMYRTFNCGIGFCVICPPDEAESVIKIAKRKGIGSDVIGKVMEDRGVRLVRDGRSISLL